MSGNDIQYFVFDIESIVDAELVSDVYFRGTVPKEKAIETYRRELRDTNNSDFIPFVYHRPISITIAKLYRDFSIKDIVSLGDGCENDTQKIVMDFWNGWNAYKFPLLITYNGRGFDMPLLELMAFKYGINIRRWHDLSVPTYQQPRNRYCTQYHFDVADWLSNYGACHNNGGLDLHSRLLDLPGKIDTKGYQVQDMYNAGELKAIHDYCKIDVLNTYFVYLRSLRVMGQMDFETELDLHKSARQFMLENVNKCKEYQKYLDNWSFHRVLQNIGPKRLAPPLD